MRAAGQRLVNMYKTQLGQDVIETMLGAGMSAGGQALFTDMTPEQIAASTVLGIGAATVGRPIVGRAGQAVGNRIAKRSPEMEKNARQGINFMVTNQPNETMQEIAKAKFAPYASQSAAGQLGQVIGRSYGDNIMQGLVAVTAPGLMPGVDDAQSN